jgi:ribosomal protein S18 acetylase RimI-like enzyme
MNPVIREYRDADFKEVSELWEQTGMGGTERGDDAATIQKTLDAGGKLLVLTLSEKEKIVGTSWLTNDGRRFYLHHFGILPQYQGRGLSKLLLQSSLNIARSEGLQIKLEVHQKNKRAVRLYKKAGFQYLGDYEIYIIRDHKRT